ncbi:MAG: protein tyrosine phosphatase [Hyphomonadaceae bacterium]|nr:protein tyrosine phosphatase [Hyphomonadaceae bacterium]
MVKLRKRKVPHVAADLSTPEGRARARRELIWSDHGFLRARFQNLHQISPEMWRSNQPSPRQIEAHARERGIKTILNLRGVSTRGYYLLEKEACAASGIELVDFQVFSRDTPTVETIFAARDLFERIQYPALMHCKSGADRAGIMSVFYKLFRQEVPFDEATEQLSLKYLHVKQGKTGMLDYFFETYRRFNQATPKPFLDWVKEDYDRLAVKAAFLETFESRLNIDRLLRRE